MAYVGLRGKDNYVVWGPMKAGKQKYATNLQVCGKAPGSKFCRRERAEFVYRPATIVTGVYRS